MQKLKNDIILTKSATETEEFAINLAKSLKRGDILCLYGNLGSGKTTFVQGLAKGLGIKRRIISPTFIIVRSYKIKTPHFAKASRGKQNSNFVYHIDLYRIQTKQDLLGVGIDEILKDEKNIVSTEWAEKLFDLLPKKRIDLKFKYIDQNERLIEVEKHG